MGIDYYTDIITYNPFEEENVSPGHISEDEKKN